MTNSATRTPASLSWIVSSRVMIAAALAVLLQFAICLVENLGNERYFANSFLKLETSRVLRTIQFEGGKLKQIYANDLDHYRGNFTSAYGYRVYDNTGQVIASSNESLFPPYVRLNNLSRLLPDSWIRHNPDQLKFHFTGGHKLLVAGNPVWIEYATAGDPTGQRYDALWMDLVEDVWVPVLPTILLLASFAIFSVRAALRPLEEASLIAEKLVPPYAGQLPTIKNLPLEANRFYVTINKLLERFSNLLSSQEKFISRAAHELRTPLGIMLLEVGKITGQRARRLEDDIEIMTGTVNRLLGLAHMDAMKKEDLTTVDLVAVLAKINEHVAPLLHKNKCTLILRDREPEPFESQIYSVRDAIVNLIENAIKHSPNGTQINVTCGPGSCVTVEDNGPGFPSGDVEKYLEPFNRGNTTVDGSGLGLAVVKKAAELHGGQVKIGTSSTGGALVQICFKK